MDLFELNDNLEIQYIDEDIVIIDNIYKNFNDLQNKVLGLIKTKKFEDESEHYDYCRTKVQNKVNEKLKQLILDISQNYFKISVEFMRDYIEFNTIRLNGSFIADNKLQHKPHRDFGINGLIYFDQFENGGTAIYEGDSELSKKEKTEYGYYFRDISDKKILKIIRAKPNRLVIFDSGRLSHGSYIEDYSIYENNERINQVIFTRYI